jgi:hypothetical protein
MPLFWKAPIVGSVISLEAGDEAQDREHGDDETGNHRFPGFLRKASRASAAPVVGTPVFL